MQKPQEIITSRQNALVTLAAKLTLAKHRAAEGLFRFDGKKLFLEALCADVPLYAVLLRQSCVASLLTAAADFSLASAVRVACLPDALFDRISEEKSPEGVICIAKRLDKIHKIATIDKWCAENGDLAGARVLFLESLRDPGNLGTIIRSAKAFGVQLVVLSEDCADIYNPRVLRAAMGTLFTQPVLICPDFPGAIRAFGRWGRVFAATLNERAVRLGEVTLRAGDAVLVGNEGHGLSQAAVDAATDTVFIPMAEGVESLNAGIAASVLLWELYRAGGKDA